jgi:hypothetical protein
MEEMGTSDEEYQTFWGIKHEQRTKARNTLMGTKVMGPAITETTNVRPYIQLPALVNGQTHFLTFLIDKGSEVTSITSVPCPKQQDPIKIQGVNAVNIAYRCPIRILVYDREPIEINAVFMSAPTDLIEMDIIQQIFGTWLLLKKNKMLQVDLAEVKIEPILLLEIQLSFTKQYPLKEGHDEVTACINTLIDKGVIERTQSFNFKSPVWPVKKPNGTYRFTVDFRKINELSPAMPGNLPDVQDLFYRIQKGAYTWFASVDLSDMFFALPLHPKSRQMTTFTWSNKQ